MGQQFCVVHAEVGVVIGVHVGGIVFCSVVLDFAVGAADAGEGDPVIVALVQVLKVDVVAVGILIPWLSGVIIYNKQ